VVSFILGFLFWTPSEQQLSEMSSQHSQVAKGFHSYPVRVVWRNKNLRQNDEYFVYVNPDEYQNWKKNKDTSIPLISVVQRWEVYIIRGDVKGDQPEHPSKGELQLRLIYQCKALQVILITGNRTAFGTAHLDSVIVMILDAGVALGLEKPKSKEKSMSMGGTAAPDTAAHQ